MLSRAGLETAKVNSDNKQLTMKIFGITKVGVKVGVSNLSTATSTWRVATIFDAIRLAVL